MKITISTHGQTERTSSISMGSAETLIDHTVADDDVLSAAFDRHGYLTDLNPFKFSFGVCAEPKDVLSNEKCVDDILVDLHNPICTVQKLDSYFAMFEIRFLDTPIENVQWYRLKLFGFFAICSGQLHTLLLEGDIDDGRSRQWEEQYGHLSS